MYREKCRNDHEKNQDCSHGIDTAAAAATSAVI